MPKFLLLLPSTAWGSRAHQDPLDLQEGNAELQGFYPSGKLELEIGQHPESSLSHLPLIFPLFFPFFGEHSKKGQHLLCYIISGQSPPAVPLLYHPPMNSHWGVL